ncbi:DMT family transporter [Palleronia caenipelagi]|uniref:DMT family transporter n=1 Tax=Palleronia caenipelagi TaxID=2489174 RepID=A0A547PMC8_9RHOB|nr:DMT family transporter [Palleronia caenipelagi]TRD15164.1 DMT family transporter [Palleronia caenipelagi]
MRDATQRAILLMVLGMAGFALEDYFIKTAAESFSASQILVILGTGGTLVFTILCRMKGQRMWSRDALDRYVMIRSASEGIAALFFVTGLTLIPLSLSSALLQSAPLVVTAGAALWLGEPVGPRRWTAVLIGLIGVLIILRPGLEGFRPAALLTVIGVLGLSVRDLVSRRIPVHIGSTAVSGWAYATTAVFAVPVMLLNSGMPAGDLQAWSAMAAAIAIGVGAYVAVTTSTRLTEVSAVIPFRYARLIFALILGVLLLGERPDALTLVGATILVGSGLYALARERALSRRRRAS